MSNRDQPARDTDGRLIVTRTGKVMTEGEIEDLVAEAEAGYILPPMPDELYAPDAVDIDIDIDQERKK